MWTRHPRQHKHISHHPTCFSPGPLSRGQVLIFHQPNGRRLSYLGQMRVACPRLLRESEQISSDRAAFESAPSARLVLSKRHEPTPLTTRPPYYQTLLFVEKLAMVTRRQINVSLHYECLQISSFCTQLQLIFVPSSHKSVSSFCRLLKTKCAVNTTKTKPNISTN
jgi:hypothetical protein